MSQQISHLRHRQGNGARRTGAGRGPHHYFLRVPRHAETSARGAMSIRVKSGTTSEEARTLASPLQVRVKGLCRLEASGDGAA